MAPLDIFTSFIDGPIRNICTHILDGPMWALPSQYMYLHVGFYVHIVKLLRHYV
jgi:hypothetical protein